MELSGFGERHSYGADGLFLSFTGHGICSNGKA